MKLLLSIALSLGLLSAWADEGKTRYYTRYINRNEVAKLVRDDVTHVVVSGNYSDGNGGGGTTGRPRLEYPSTTHVQTMNGAKGIGFDIFPISSAFPSPEQTKRINSLHETIRVVVAVEQCLSTESEKNRLLGFERPIDVRVECHSNLAADRALKLAAEIMNQKKHIRVIVERRE